MNHAARPAQVAAATLAFLTACSSAGSGGGCSCVKPLPSPFPQASVVDRAATIRVTKPGLEFLSAHLGTIIARNLQPTGAPFVVDVPASSATGIRICANGANRTASPPECTAEVDFSRAALRVDGVASNKLRIAGTVPIRVPNLRVGALGLLDFGLGVGSPLPTCTGNVPNVSNFTTLNLVISAPLIGSPSTIRPGATVIDAANSEVTVSIPRDGVTLCNASSIVTSVAASIVALAFGTLESTLADRVREALGDATCLAPDGTRTPPCPSGSRPDDADPSKWSKCVHTATPTLCVPSPLGLEGTVDLGSLLASFAPGTKALLDVLFGARGPLDPAPGLPSTGRPYVGATPNGITLAFGGGTLPSPKSSCVPMAAPSLPSNVPVPDELRADQVQGVTGGPHVGIGLSERFLSYALGQTARAGLLCLDVSGDRVPLVNTAILSLLARSLPTLAHEARSSAALVRLRPRGLPTVTVGGGTNERTDPLLSVRVPNLRLEVYTWVYRRWVHAFDLEATVVAKIDLDVVQNASFPRGALVPTIGDVVLEDAHVDGAELISEDGPTIARNFSGLLALVAGRLGALAPIDLSSALNSYGLSLEFPTGGIRRLVKGDDRFIGVFLNFALAAGPRVLLPPALSIEGHGGAWYARFARASSDEEWSLSVDGIRFGGWRPTTDGRLDAPPLVLDGLHEIGIATRPRGVSSATSDTVRSFVRVDHEPPIANLDPESGELQAWDRVSGATLEVQRGFASGFVPLSGPVVLDPGESAVVRDEAGLTTRVAGPPIFDDAARGCAICTPRRRNTGQSSPFGPTALGLFAGAAAVVRRRRARARRITGLAVGFGSLVSACSRPATVALTGCGAGCESVCKPELPRGVTGSYLATAVDDAGTRWFSGYEDTAIFGPETFTYGDWHVGRWDEAAGAVGWEAVAGMPAPYTDGRCPAHPSSGYRRGRFEQGSDVGRSTTLAVAKGGELLGAAYDATLRGVVFGSRATGGTWSTHVAVARAGADVGRHVRLVVRDGRPWLFYLATEPSGGDGRALRSSLEVARANSAMPKRASDWSVETVHSVAVGPCRQVQCAAGAYCSPSSRRCEDVHSACTSCDGGPCVTDQPDGGVTCSPSAVAPSLETALPSFADGFAILSEGELDTFAVNDGAAGELALLTPEGRSWRRTTVDGSLATGVSRGIGPSIARATDGTLHLFSFDGNSGALHHVAVRGTQVVGRNLVDDGSGVGTSAFDDAPHAFGRESAARASGSGVAVYYQDARMGALRTAVGISAGQGVFRFALTATAGGRGVGGFFPVPLEDGRVAHFWRSYDPQTHAAVGGVAIVSP